MSDRVLIKNATVIAVDPTIGILDECDVLIQGSTIKEVGQHIDSERATEIFDASSCIVSPGFVDTHHHLWQQLLRSLTTDWSLGDYIDQIRNIYGSLFTPEDVYVANHFAALDLINNGVTTVIDHCHILNSAKHTDAAIRALQDAGIRGTWCYGLYENPPRSDIHGFDHQMSTPAGFDGTARRVDAKRAREQYFGLNDPERQLLTFGAAPTEAEMMSQGDLREEIRFFRSLGARVITMHVAMGNYDLGKRTVEQLEEEKCIGKDLLFSHGSAWTNHEIDLIREAGAGVSSTPETDLQMGMGHPVAFRAADAGCKVGFGIDITSNQNNDMLALIRLVLQAERSKRHLEMLGKHVPTDIQPKAQQALYLATLGGAKSIGLDHLVGSITPGKRADIIITRCDDMNVVPVIKPIGSLIHNANVSNIEAVMIDGRWMKKNGRVLNIDWPSMRQDVRERTANMIAIAASAPSGGAISGWNWRE